MSNIYPSGKKKKVLLAASGVDTSVLSPEQQQAADSQQRAIKGLDSFANAAAVVPVYGQLVAGITKAAIGLDKGLSKATKNADGTYKNAFSGAVDKQFNPLSTFKAVSSGKPKEVLRSIFQHSTLGFGEKVLPKLFGRSPADIAAENARKARDAAAINDVTMQSRQAYGSLGQRQNTLYRKGGNIYPGGSSMAIDTDVAVVLGGKRHSQGGNPVVDTQTGEKKAETEREELLFSKGQTDEMGRLMARRDFSGLGTVVSNIVNHRLQDNSGKYQKKAGGTMYPTASVASDMVQLSGNGRVEAPIEGAERIYSRKDAARIMALARKGKGGTALGRFVYEATKRQDRQAPQYT